MPPHGGPSRIALRAPGGVAQRWPTELFAKPGHDFRQKRIGEEQSVATEPLRRAQQPLVDPGESWRRSLDVVLPQHQELKPAIQPLGRNGMDNRRLRMRVDEIRHKDRDNPYISNMLA